MTLVDNLIVVNSTLEGRSYIFDVKKSNPSKPIGLPRGIPRHNVKVLPRQTEVLMTVSTSLESRQSDVRRSRSAPHDSPEDSNKNMVYGTYSGKKEENQVIYGTYNGKGEENQILYGTYDEKKEKNQVIYASYNEKKEDYGGLVTLEVEAEDSEECKQDAGIDMKQ